MSRNLLPICVAAHRGVWQRYLARQRNQKFQELKSKILAKLDYTCSYCGFYSDKYQQVVNKDYDYNNNSLKNLAVACSFCISCLFLDGAGHSGHCKGKLIYLPEISQADLNNFIRILFVSMFADATYRNRLTSVFISLEERSQQVEEIFGSGSSEPNSFAQSLLDLDKTIVYHEHPIVKNIRLLPSPAGLEDQIKYWRETVFASLPL